MRKCINIFLMILLMCGVANAQTWYSWRYRTHATDCTSLTDGKARDLCFEQDDQTMYKCVPSAGDCDTVGEWKAVEDVTDTDTTCDGGSCSIANSGTLDGYEASALLDNTDTQDLSLASNTLSLVDGGSVDLSGYLDNTDDQTCAEVSGCVENAITSSALSGYMQDEDINTFAELQSWVSDATLVKAGTLTDTKFCAYDSGAGTIVCNSDAGATLTEEQVEDYVGGMLGGTETRITVTYDDAGNAINFVVDDMNDDQPESADLDTAFCGTDGKLLGRTGGTWQCVDPDGTGTDDQTCAEVSGCVESALVGDDIDASSELLEIMDDETGTGLLVFNTAPTFATSITGSYLTASEMLITDGDKKIVSAPVATYPSLTELSYLKGATSSVQTQIDSLVSHLKFNLSAPNDYYTNVDHEIAIIPQTDGAITITDIECTLDATTNELAFDLKFADTFIGLANATVIDVCDTSSGVTSISSGFDDATVPANKAVYILLDATPHADITQLNCDISYTYD